MTTEPAAVVPVLPEDSAADVLEKLRGVGAGHVQLLVTEGAVVMRRAEVAEQIRKFGAKAGMALTVISSDPKVIQAAHRAGLETLTVEHARVLPPGPDNRPPRSASPYATRPVPRAAPPGPDASDEEVLRAALGGDVAAAPPPPTVEPAPRRPEPPQRRPEPAPRRPEPPPRRSEAAPQPRRRAWPIYALSALLLLLLAAIGAVLFLGGRVTVAVSPPARATTSAPFTGLPVPLLAPGAGVSGTAVLAEPIVSTVAITSTGTVAEGTLTPAGSAEGPVTILNSSGQAILLPAGTEFVAIRPDGQEAPFISAADVLVPAATTADQGAQIVTTRGQAQVTVTARSPGSASNVEANTIRRITPPGGPTFNVSAGSLLVQHPPLTGGSEEVVFIVKESDVQPLLAPALEQLDAEARRQLSGLARTRGLAIDPSAISP
ncbi:MAG: baseplate J/gp47 family protein, partial [Chloroflexaceae bacterium]|nr:baseplate J/gp47 family protein [Chloroflexaceae bacterium]